MTPKANIFYTLIDVFGKDQITKEFQFAPPRKFRFDWCIEKYKIAVEYEGIVAGKSRHTSIKGYTGDCEKYNIATLNGWRIFRYTALNYKDLRNDLGNLLKIS
jgi:hypothetical protein